MSNATEQLVNEAVKALHRGKLVDRKELYRLFPALRGKGKNPRWRLDYLIRMRLIPFVRLGKRSIGFDEDAIRKWIQQNSIPVQNRDENGK
jgi:hypothetical protein